jgi:hypothetical protein
MQEGTELLIEGREFGLVTGRAAEFRFDGPCIRPKCWLWHSGARLIFPPSERMPSLASQPLASTGKSCSERFWSVACCFRSGGAVDLVARPDAKLIQHSFRKVT